MLYDPKWEKQAEQKTDPFSLTSMIAWLEKQPSEKEYCYGNTGGCLLHQYMTAHGFTVHGVGGSTWRINPLDDCKRTDIPESFANIAAYMPHTYGAALSRARALLWC